MGNKFSDFVTNENFCNNKEQIEEKIEEVKKQNYNENIDTKNAENLINKYSTYSKDELMNELFKVTKEKKQNGTLNSDLENFSNTVMPYLTEEQKEIMNDLFNKIK